MNLSDILTSLLPTEGTPVKFGALQLPPTGELVENNTVPSVAFDSIFSDEVLNIYSPVDTDTIPTPTILTKVEHIVAPTPTTQTSPEQYQSIFDASTTDRAIRNNATENTEPVYLPEVGSDLSEFMSIGKQKSENSQQAVIDIRDFFNFTQSATPVVEIYVPQVSGNDTPVNGDVSKIKTPETVETSNITIRNDNGILKVSIPTSLLETVPTNIVDTEQSNNTLPDLLQQLLQHSDKQTADTITELFEKSNSLPKGLNILMKAVGNQDVEVSQTIAGLLENIGIDGAHGSVSPKKLGVMPDITTPTDSITDGIQELDTTDLYYSIAISLSQNSIQQVPQGNGNNYDTTQDVINQADTSVRQIPLVNSKVTSTAVSANSVDSINSKNAIKSVQGNDETTTVQPYKNETVNKADVTGEVKLSHKLHKGDVQELPTTHQQENNESVFPNEVQDSPTLSIFESTATSVVAPYVSDTSNNTVQNSSVLSTVVTNSIANEQQYIVPEIRDESIQPVDKEISTSLNNDMANNVRPTIPTIASLKVLIQEANQAGLSVEYVELSFSTNNAQPEPQNESTFALLNTLAKNSNIPEYNSFDTKTPTQGKKQFEAVTTNFNSSNNTTGTENGQLGKATSAHQNEIEANEPHNIAQRVIPESEVPASNPVITANRKVNDVKHLNNNIASNNNPILYPSTDSDSQINALIEPSQSDVLAEVHVNKNTIAGFKNTTLPPNNTNIEVGRTDTVDKDNTNTKLNLREDVQKNMATVKSVQPNPQLNTISNDVVNTTIPKSSVEHYVVDIPQTTGKSVQDDAQVVNTTTVSQPVPKQKTTTKEADVEHQTTKAPDTSLSRGNNEESTHQGITQVVTSLQSSDVSSENNNTSSVPPISRNELSGRVVTPIDLKYSRIDESQELRISEAHVLLQNDEHPNSTQIESSIPNVTGKTTPQKTKSSQNQTGVVTATPEGAVDDTTELKTIQHHQSELTSDSDTQVVDCNALLNTVPLTNDISVTIDSEQISTLLSDEKDQTNVTKKNDVTPLVTTVRGDTTFDTIESRPSTKDVSAKVVIGSTESISTAPLKNRTALHNVQPDNAYQEQEGSGVVGIQASGEMVKQYVEELPITETSKNIDVQNLVVKPRDVEQETDSDNTTTTTPKNTQSPSVKSVEQGAVAITNTRVSNTSESNTVIKPTVETVKNITNTKRPSPVVKVVESVPVVDTNTPARSVGNNDILEQKISTNVEKIVIPESKQNKVQSNVPQLPEQADLITVLTDESDSIPDLQVVQENNLAKETYPIVGLGNIEHEQEQRVQKQPDVRLHVRDLRSRSEMFKSMSKISGIENNPPLAQVWDTNLQQQPNKRFALTSQQQASVVHQIPVSGLVENNVALPNNDTSVFGVAKTDAIAALTLNHENTSVRKNNVKKNHPDELYISESVDEFVDIISDFPSQNSNQDIEQDPDRESQDTPYHQSTEHNKNQVAEFESGLQQNQNQSRTNEHINTDVSTQNVRAVDGTTSVPLHRILGFAGEGVKTPQVSANKEGSALPMYKIPIESFAHTTSIIVRNTPMGESSAVRLVLTPEALGTVVVQMQMNERENMLRIEVESHETRNVVEAQLPVLREQLAQSGVRMDSVSVQVKQTEQSMQNNSHQQQHTSQQQQREDREQRSAFARSFAGERDELVQRERGDASGKESKGRKQQRLLNKKFEYYA